MLCPYNQDHVLPVILKKPDQHRPFAVALDVGDRFADIEWRTDPADSNRISKSWQRGSPPRLSVPQSNRQRHGRRQERTPTSSRSCSSCPGLAQDIADLRGGGTTRGMIIGFGHNLLACMQPRSHLRPALDSNPAPPVLNEMPRGQQAVLISCPSGRSRPVSFELRWSRRIEPGDSGPERYRAAVRQWDHWLMPVRRRAVHTTDGSTRIQGGVGPACES